MNTAMTINSFLNKSFKAMFSAAAFLEEHKNWLLTGEVSKYTKDILVKLENGELTPVPALNEINKALVNLQLSSKSNTNITGVKKTTNSGSRNFTKPFVAAIYDKSGFLLSDDESNDLIKGFDLNSKAHDWSCRKLVDSPSESYAVISHSGTNISFTLTQTMAYSQIFKSKPGVISKKKFPKTAPLTSKAKVKNDHFKFSHG